MSVENKILAKLQSQDWTTNEELENMFPKGVEGHYSWAQRLRGLRDKGYIVKRRIHEGSKRLSEWRLEAPSAPQPQFSVRQGQMVFIG
jgi:hypothetical protein